MTLIQQLSEKCNLPQQAISATVKLMDDGNTIPFLARYRKELTGNLNEDQLRCILNQLRQLRSLEQRKITILSAIEKQDLISTELINIINSADSQSFLEEFYKPFKLKKKTRATIARSKGLEGLANLIIEQKTEETDLKLISKPFLSKTVHSIEEAFGGARDIIAEKVCTNQLIRKTVRKNVMRNCTLVSKLRENSQDKELNYQSYYDFSCKIRFIQPHQLLAIFRGEREKILKVNLVIQDKEWIEPIFKSFPIGANSVLSDQLTRAILDLAPRLLLPAVERDIRNELFDYASDHAVSVFAHNLGALLTQPPFPNMVILAIDPGYRSGCKIAVVNPSGKVLDTSTIYPHNPQKQWEQAKTFLNTLIHRHSVNLIVIGNGTASRESVELTAELISGTDVKYLVTNEAGASVYSASKLAKEELPDLDVTLRGAVSIARRVQDPLAELVKIEPRAIGVGLYQHDIKDTKLKERFSYVVESVVNQIGVDVNTASVTLLSYVAGIGPDIAKKIVAYRDSNGQFNTKMDLLLIQGFGEKTFQQSGGFLRIHNGINPLDSTSIHPENYLITEKIIELSRINLGDNFQSRKASLKDFLLRNPPTFLSEQLGIGLPTLTDILDQLVTLGHDVREVIPKPLLRSEILKIADVRENQILYGTVRNVVDFGVFIDIGVKMDGLLHKSKFPTEVNLRIGDIVKVAILEIQIDRHHISLGWVES